MDVYPIKSRQKSSSGFNRVFWQGFVCTILACTLILFITLIITLRFSIHFAEEKMENTIMSVSTSLAASSMVTDALLSGACSPELTDYLNDLLTATDDLDIITIADTDSVRIYHLHPEQIGKRFVGGDEGPALKGEQYLSLGTGTMGLQRRAFSPVWSDGQIIGFVMASATVDKIHQIRQNLISYYIQLLFLLLFCSYVTAGILSMLIRRVFQGHEPEALMHTFLMQEEVLETLDEGIISTDVSGCILLANEAAAQMLGSDVSSLEGKPLRQFLLNPDGECLSSQSMKNMPTGKPNTLYSSIPVLKGNQPYGTVYILTDRTEAMRAAEQLTGSLHIISALRANSHEFMNKLQVISGFLQMNQPEQALHYITDVSAVHAEALAPILQCIRNQSVAALLLGKLSNMKEMKIRLTLLPGSSLPPHSQYLSTSDLITVIGNLLENALEAINARMDNGPRMVDLQITETESSLLILITDTGIGIPPENMKKLFEQGFSTKASRGRGIGMTLVQDIIIRTGSTIEIESEPGIGSTFTIVTTQKRDRGGRE